MRRCAYERGFSLVEIMVASAVFFLFLSGVLAILGFGGRSVSAGSLQNDSVQQGALAIEALLVELKSASRVLLPAKGKDGGCLVFEDDNGLLKSVYLSPSRKYLLLRVAGRTKGSILAHTSRTSLLFSPLHFRNEDGRGLSVAISFAKPKGRGDSVLVAFTTRIQIRSEG